MWPRLTWAKKCVFGWLKRVWGMANLGQPYRDSLASFGSPNRACQLSQALASHLLPFLSPPDAAFLVTSRRRAPSLAPASKAHATSPRVRWAPPAGSTLPRREKEKVGYQHQRRQGWRAGCVRGRRSAAAAACRRSWVSSRSHSPSTSISSREAAPRPSSTPPRVAAAAPARRAGPRPEAPARRWGGRRGTRRAPIAAAC